MSEITRRALLGAAGGCLTALSSNAFARLRTETEARAGSRASTLAGDFFSEVIEGIAL